MLPRSGPSSPSTTLADNRRLILEVLRAGGELTRTEIAEISGLSSAATARITDQLETERLIVRTGQVPSGGGRPAWRYRFVAEGRYLAGVRVQDEGCRGALLSWDETIVSRHEVLLSEGDATGEEILEATCECVRRVVQDATDRGRPPLALGVAVPAVTDAEGHARAGTEVGWRDVALRDRLTDIAGVPVLVENDANALAYSELKPGEHTTSLASLILGYGLGAGVISDGRLLRGTHYAAGEVGYLLTSRDVLSAGSTESGDLEQRIQRAARSRPETASAVPAQLWSLMGRGTEQASAAAAEMLDYMAMAIASLVVVVDPERVVIGDVPPSQVEPLTSELNARLHGLLLHDPTVTVARRGADAVLIGAALLAGELVDVQAI